MTDRLREKAEELAHALWCDAVDGYDESFLIMKIAVPMIHAVLLSARDEALEEAAVIAGGLDFRRFGFPDDESNGGEADEGTVGFCVASIAISQRIRSLKSKV